MRFNEVGRDFKVMIRVRVRVKVSVRPGVIIEAREAVTMTATMTATSRP